MSSSLGLGLGLGIELVRGYFTIIMHFCKERKLAFFLVRRDKMFGLRFGVKLRVSFVYPMK